MLTPAKMRLLILRASNLVQDIPFLASWLSRAITNLACLSTEPRPRPFSLWSSNPVPSDLTHVADISDYTTWPGLTNKRFSGRHLPPASQAYVDGLPKDTPYNPMTGDIGDVTRLYLREGEMTKSRSTVLFMSFAQWFTDSVLRIDPTDRRKNTSNHNIDLCQIYGLTEETAHMLRAHEGGRLSSQMVDGEEYLDYLGEIGADGKWQVKEKYQNLPYVVSGSLDQTLANWGEDRQEKLYAVGLDRGNSTIGYVAISTLFMREHNRICGELASRYPGWDDERLFQTARMINTVILMKLVVEDYINHIVGTKLFTFDVSFAEKQRWYREPYIAVEFDLLYRWHGMIPDAISVDGVSYDHSQYRFNNALFEKAGFDKVVAETASQPAGQISVKNVPKFMAGAEYAALKMSRDFRLQSFNTYREQFGLNPLSSFAELTDDKALQKQLKDLYGSIDNLELLVGLFSEKTAHGSLFGALLDVMVSYDAFSQIYTNPLVSKNIYNAQTYTQYGLDLIEATHTVQDLVDRNTNGQAPKATFDYAG